MEEQAGARSSRRKASTSGHKRCARLNEAGIRAAARINHCPTWFPGHTRSRGRSASAAECAVAQPVQSATSTGAAVSRAQAPGCRSAAEARVKNGLAASRPSRGGLLRQARLRRQTPAASHSSLQHFPRSLARGNFMAFLVPVNHNGGRNIYEPGTATSVPGRSRHFPVADDFRGARRLRLAGEDK
ncbi:hypothetical protein MTO96_001428 [Rhipicephalus appendiculatus]